MFKVSEGEIDVKKLGYILAASSLMLAAALPMSAQSGCVDSPENPTAILGLIVSAAGIGFVQIRGRIQARRDKRNK